MNRLKELRIERELSQEEVGKIIGISGQALGLYENGRRDIPTKNLIKLANLYNVSADYILCKTDIRNPDEVQEDPLGLTQVGFNMDEYTPPTEKQKEQIRDILEIILKDNKKDKKE